MQQEEHWFSAKDIKLAAGLKGMNSENIDDAIRKAQIIYEKGITKSLSPDDRLLLGLALALGGNCSEGYDIIADVGKEVLRTANGYNQSRIWRRAGWVAFLAGDKRKTKEAFDEVLSDISNHPKDRKNWGYDEWVAAYFTGKAGPDELIESLAKTHGSRADDSYFYIGEKLMKEGKLKEAKESYQRCIEMSKISKDTYPSNWAKWRLKQMEEREKVNK